MWLNPFQTPLLNHTRNLSYAKLQPLTPGEGRICFCLKQRTENPHNRRLIRKLSSTLWWELETPSFARTRTKIAQTCGFSRITIRLYTMGKGSGHVIMLRLGAQLRLHVCTQKNSIMRLSPTLRRTSTKHLLLRALS